MTYFSIQTYKTNNLESAIWGTNFGSSMSSVFFPPSHNSIVLFYYFFLLGFKKRNSPPLDNEVFRAEPELPLTSVVFFVSLTHRLHCLTPPTSTCCRAAIVFIFMSVYQTPFFPGEGRVGPLSSASQAAAPASHLPCLHPFWPPAEDAANLLQLVLGKSSPKSRGRDEVAPAALGAEHRAGGGMRRVAHVCQSCGSLFVLPPAPGTAPCWRFYS